MPTDITTIPTQELVDDLRDSYEDIVTCEVALRLGIAECNGISTQERLDKNRYFVKVIRAELERRGIKIDLVD